MRSPHRIAAAAMGCGVAILALAGCSSPGTTAPQQTSPPSSTTQVHGTPVDTPTRQVRNQQVEGSADGIAATITPQDRTTVRPGGAALRFDLTLVNTTTTDHPQIGLVVSLGHCSCDTAGSAILPAGRMRMFDAGTDAWLSVPYVAEGTGTDFLTTTLVPPFALEHGQSIHYRLELRLNASQTFTVVHGAASIDTTLTNAGTHVPLGVSPTASLPITVQP